MKPVGHPARRWRHPLPGESLDGYLAYRASHVLMPGPFAIAALGGIQQALYPEIAFGDGATHDGLSEIAEELEVCVADLRSRAHPLTRDRRRRFADTELDRRLIERRTRRFAPAAIAASPHHRALWAVRCLPFCEESWQFLINRCPQPYCNAVQRWRHSSGLDRCDACGASLTTAYADAVPQELRAELQSLCGLVHHDPARRARSMAELPLDLRRLEPGGILEAACAVAGLHDPRIRHRQVAFPRHDVDPLELMKAMSAAWKSLRCWPDAGERLAGERLAIREGRFGDGNHDATFDFVSLALHGSAASEATRTVAGTLADKLTGNRGEGVPIKSAVIGTGMKVTTLTRLRREGGVRTLFHLVGRNRVIPLVANDSLERLRAARPSGSTARITAARLGITHDGVERLVHHHLFEIANGDIAKLVTPTTVLDDDSIDRFIARIESAAIGLQGDDWISLASAAGCVGGDLKPWALWFDDILHGRITAAMRDGDGPLTKRILLSPDVTSLLRSRMEAHRVIEPDLFPFASRADAGAILNIHTRHHDSVFAQWPVLDRRRASVPLGTVRRMAAEFISTSEIADILALRPQAVRQSMARWGLSLDPRGYPRSAFSKRQSGSPGKARSGSQRIK